MTQPVLVGLLYDLPGKEPKVFFRAMLYATGKRGHIVESLYLKVRCGDLTRDFNFWMYGETNALMIGSGLRVGEDGVSSNHHFLPPKEASSFTFLAGDYTIDVYAHIVKRSARILLKTVRISLSQEQAATLRDPTMGVLFTLVPDSQCYEGSVSQGPTHSYPPGKGKAARE